MAAGPRWAPQAGDGHRVARRPRETDLFAFRDYRRPGPSLPATVPVRRLKTVMHPGSPHQFRWRMAWLGRRGIPLEVAMHRTDNGPRLEFESWVSTRYDLVWFDRAATFEWLGRPQLGPTIIDLHDLEDAESAIKSADHQGRSVATGGSSLQFARL